jgi:hypothetical protein
LFYVPRVALLFGLNCWRFMANVTKPPMIAPSQLNIGVMRDDSMLNLNVAIALLVCYHNEIRQMLQALAGLIVMNPS